MPRESDHWRELCIAAAFEENPQKLMELVSELNKYLVERQEQLADRIFERLARQPVSDLSQKHRIH
jgi:hypothetical protein